MPALLSRKAPPSTTFTSDLQRLLTDEFDQVAVQCGADSAESQQACVKAMHDLRKDVLRLLDAIHSDQRRRLARNVRVNRLPVEILVNIFSYFPTTELVTLTHVCHYWRVLAVARPSLWSTIELEGDCASALRELLPRSEAAPVDLLLTRYSDRGWRPERVLNAVAPYIDRVRTLSIRPLSRRTSIYGWDSPMSILSIGEMPPHPITLALPENSRLQRLDISWDGPKDGMLTISRRTTSPSPVNASLQYVSLRGVYYQPGLLSPCTNLRSLELELLVNCKVSDIFSIVQSNPLLRRLALYRLPFSRDPRRNWVQAGPVVQNSIEKLTLSAERAVISELEVLLHRLCAPAIRTAVLHIQSDNTASAVVLIQSSLAQLHTIHFLDLRHSRFWALLRVEDARGAQRAFTRQYSVELLTPLLPRLDHALRPLRVATHEWVAAVNAAPGVQLLALEELHLVGSVLDFSPRQRSVFCPRLATVVVELEDALAPSPPVSSETHWTLAAAIVAVRLHGYPRPLRELVIVDPDAAPSIDNTAHTGLFQQLICVERARFPSARLTDRPFDDISNEEIANAL